MDSSGASGRAGRAALRAGALKSIRECCWLRKDDREDALSGFLLLSGMQFASGMVLGGSRLGPGGSRVAFSCPKDGESQVCFGFSTFPSNSARKIDLSHEDAFYDEHFFVKQEEG